MSLRIEVTRHIDCSERAADGSYEYYYEFDLLKFTEGDIALVARSYVDSPAQAHILRMEHKGIFAPVSEADLKTPMAAESIRQLREIGKHTIELLGPGGYEPLPASI